MLGEPPRTQADLNFSLFGIPVRVSPLFWLIGLLLGAQGEFDMVDFLAWMVAFFLSILLHELGHAAALLGFGQRPWITLHGFGGLTSHDPSYAYGRRARQPGHLGEIGISLAGPMAGFALAGLALGLQIVLVQQLREPSQAMFFVKSLLFYLVWVNVFWGLLNLVPVLPLDGGQIARETLTAISPRRGARGALGLSVVVALVAAVAAFYFFHSIFLPLMFLYFAYTNWQALQAYRTHDAW